MVFRVSDRSHNSWGYVEGEISLPIGGDTAPFYIELISDIDS